LTLVLALASLLILFLAYTMITDYRPKDKNSLQVINQKDEILRKGNQISVLTFNIGYCGLDKGQDFFMDGGTMSRSSSSEQTLSNLKSITKILVEEKPSFLMLQEVDKEIEDDSLLIETSSIKY